MATLLSFAYTLVVFVLVAGLHELGHFLVAKAAGVYAPKFSLGIGRTLWRRRWGETEYCISLLPFGGFVRLASRDDASAMATLEGGTSEQRTPEDADYDATALMPFGPNPVPRERTLEAQSLPVQLAVMSAGVAMNLLLGVVALAALASYYGRPIIPTRMIGGVRQVPGIGAAAAALRVGDTVIAVDGHAVTNWNDVISLIDRPDTAAIALTTQRGVIVLPRSVQSPAGGALELVPIGVRHRRATAMALEPFFAPVILRLAPDGAGARAGLAMGDSIVAVEQQPVRSWSEVRRQIERAPGRPIAMELVRRGGRLTLRVTPDSAIELDDATGQRILVGRLSVTLRPITIREELSAVEALTRGFSAALRLSASTACTMGRMLIGRTALSELSGPVAIAEQSATAARRGTVHVLGVLAFLTINVALFNLLPIPVLDGGQILMAIWEAARGRRFAPVVRERIMRAGLLIMIALFCLVMISDMWKALNPGA